MTIDAQTHTGIRFDAEAYARGFDDWDIPALLAASDLFVLPSLWEGLPMALLEAMASRTPTIATSVDGTRGVLEDGVSGVLVPPADAPALADAIAWLACDKDVRRQLAQGGWERVDRCYSVDRQAAAHAALYDRMGRDRRHP